MVKIVNRVDKSTTSVDYQTNGVKRIRISNNLSAIDVVGQLGDNAAISALRIVRLGSNVEKLLPSCFMNCGNLAEVDVPEKCVYIEDSAFRNCTSLTKINCIQGDGQVIKKIGPRGFAGCDGLEDITLKLNGNPAEMYEILGNECFASCANLQTVKFTGSAFVSKRMFAGCDSLTSIQLANSQGYAYPEGFSDIKTIQEITIPNKTWIVNDGMFKGCEMLSNVIFADGETMETSSNIELMGNAVFEGCTELKEIRIPRSITSFSQLGDYFLAGSNISCVRFDGIPREYFGQYQVETKLSYTTGKWYVGKDQKSCATTLKIAKYAKSNKIPLIIQMSRNESIAQIQVKKNKMENYADQKWISILNGLQLNKNYFYIKNWYDSGYNADMYKWVNDQCNKELNLNTEAGYTYIILLWNNGNNFYQIFENAPASTNLNTNTRFNDTLSKAFKGYTPPKTTVHEIKESSKVTLMGLSSTSCLYYASDGSYRIVNSDGTIRYKAQEQVDEYSKVNFKTGRWYYNAIQLKDFADKHNIPVVIEYSSKGCTPCEYWAKNSFNNEDFQNWVKQQKYLFCRIEKKSANESWEDKENNPQLNFIEYGWVKAQERKIPYPPVFCWYWKKADGSEVHDVSSYHFAQGVDAQPPWTDAEFYQMTKDKFENYREKEDIAGGLRCPDIEEYKGDKQYPIYRKYTNQFAKALADYSKLYNDIKAYDEVYMFGDYLASLKQRWDEGQTEGIGPEDYYEITDPDEKNEYLSTYIRNNAYKGELDPNGVFFACQKKDKISKYSGTITIKSGKPMKNPEVGANVGDSVEGDGTYQVFLASNMYMYDKDSLIFRVRDGKIEYMYRCTNYVDADEEVVPVGYSMNEWVDFDGKEEGSGLSSMIDQAETKSIAIAMAVYIEGTDDKYAEVLDGMDGYIVNSGMYWLKLKVSDRSQFNLDGTAANQFQKFIQRDYIGGWNPPETTQTPSIYLYRGCSTCGIGNPAVYMHEVMSMNGNSASQLTAWIESKKNAEE